MKRPWIVGLGVPVLLGLTVLVGVYLISRPSVQIIERTTYESPKPDPEMPDDDWQKKNPAFDPAVVDSRSIEDWDLNQSAAVFRVDCPVMKPDQDNELLMLRPSYAAAIQTAQKRGLTLLPSSNLVSGAAKQFDDGLYAAVDLACFRGQLGFSPAAPQWVESVFNRLPKESPARPFLGAALELGGRKAALSAEETQKKQELLDAFDANKALSKPISFYEWTPELQQVWRFYRFLQREFDKDDELALCRDIAAVLQADPELLKQYRAINGFYGRLTNPLISLPVDVLIGNKETLEALQKRHGSRHPAVAVFPPSTSRETELFEDVFPRGIPAGAELMSTLVRRIRSGEVDLKPGAKDGWYQYQVYALETMLLPTKGQESDKLALSGRYKKRLVEAFKALVTKHRETHARQLYAGEEKSAEAKGPPSFELEVRPRLRIEPCPTFYLRTARAYAFLENFLVATAGKERLAQLHGMKPGGQRPMSLAEELAAIRQRFYGFYLVSCEDLGMKPQFLPDEPVDRAAAQGAALKWLGNLAQDPDLAIDTRVSVPLYLDPFKQKTRLWATLGVRLARMDASYAKPPKVRHRQQGGEWREVELYRCRPSDYVLPVDEFAEIELPGLNSLTRTELRALCDRHQTKEAILQAVLEMPR